MILFTLQSACNSSTGYFSTVCQSVSQFVSFFVCQLPTCLHTYLPIKWKLTNNKVNWTRKQTDELHIHTHAQRHKAFMAMRRHSFQMNIWLAIIPELMHAYSWIISRFSYIYGCSSGSTSINYSWIILHFCSCNFSRFSKNVCKSLTEVIAFNGLLNGTPTNSSHILLIVQ